MLSVRWLCRQECNFSGLLAPDLHVLVKTVLWTGVAVWLVNGGELKQTGQRPLTKHKNISWPCADSYIQLCNYGLSTGPTEGLGLWWMRYQLSPDNQRQQPNQYKCNKMIKSTDAAKKHHSNNMWLIHHASLSSSECRHTSLSYHRWTVVHPVLTATSHRNGQTSTPHRIKTPWPITIKLCKIDYVHETNE